MSTLQHEVMPLYYEQDGDIMPPEVDSALTELYGEEDLEYNANRAFESEQRSGVSVALADRAFALESIMHYYNRANRTAGLAHAAETSPIAEGIWKRYGTNTPDVVSGAQRNVLSKRTLLDRNLAVLAGADDMRAQGIPEDEIDLVTKTIQIELGQQYGVGNAKAADRAKMIRQVRRSTNKILQ